LHQTGGGAVEADNAGRTEAGDDIGLQTGTSVDIDHLDLFINIEACGLH